jgi:REP element-mobilizing transposase RayT
MSRAWVGRYVIMPDHVHLFVRPSVSLNLGTWGRGLKRALSQEMTGPHHQGERWQPGFFDHLLRHSESYEEKWEYVRQNPVRAGLVERAENWPYQGEIALLEW